MNDPRRLTLLAAAGPSRFAGNRDYRAMMGPVEDSVLEQVRRRQLDPDCTDGTDIAAMLGRGALRGRLADEQSRTCATNS